MKVCLGGTFDPFHKGHEALLKKAFEVAESHGFVFIGVTSDIHAKRKGDVRSFNERKQAVEQFLQKVGLNQRSTVQELADKYGPTIEGDFDAIIVSPETKPTAEEINKKRQQHGKKPLQIVVIPFVLADDSQPISSSRIRRKEIDAQGTLLRKE
jgi:pantetheine-phosphate adenylyltransferase